MMKLTGFMNSLMIVTVYCIGTL